MIYYNGRIRKKAIKRIGGYFVIRGKPKERVHLLDLSKKLPNYSYIKQNSKKDIIINLKFDFSTKTACYLYEYFARYFLNYTFYYYYPARRESKLLFSKKDIDKIKSKFFL